MAMSGSLVPMPALCARVARAPLVRAGSCAVTVTVLPCGKEFAALAPATAVSTGRGHEKYLHVASLCRKGRRSYMHVVEAVHKGATRRPRHTHVPNTILDPHMYHTGGRFVLHQCMSSRHGEGRLAQKG